jgi:thiol-disulfide isomerase/thioredoxin
LGDWRGKTLLVVLWAEWCAPCLAEMPALAKLNAKHRSRSFEILPIVTGSHTIASVEDAKKRLARLPGADIDTLVDGSSRGNALMFALGETKVDTANLPKGAVASGGSLPCLVVVDAAGRVRARAVGLGVVNGRSTWETPVGDAFVKQLANGV